jgi:hypothetical protein
MQQLACAGNRKIGRSPLQLRFGGTEYGFPRQTQHWQNVTKSVMPDGKRENWLELCSKISVEHDPIRFAKLIEELVRELDEHPLSMKLQHAPQRPISWVKEGERL